MYLAKHKIRGKIRYFIRESFESENGVKCRDLFDLGSDPSTYIVYLDRNAFYIDTVVEDQLFELGVQPATEDLEAIFWPFIAPDVKRVIEPFRQRAARRKKLEKLNAAQEAKIHADVHIFDKRRMHFLRTGQMDQGFIGQMPAKLIKGLVGKSRDEIEQSFMVQEQVLRPRELKAYVYVIFDLQRFFKELVARKAPLALDQNKVDQHFLEEICKLNQSRIFWGDTQKRSFLHEYLVRYAIMFFDNEYGHSSILDDYVRNFINRHRTYRPPPPKDEVSVEDARAVFGLEKETVKTTTIRELTRRYRRRAQKLHPDKGGEHHQFIKLTEAYQILLRKIRAKH